ncbi:hypothetical protein Goari_021546, partial [Gossypium aridum]|nr:hypothetical protein [Gossypium aridum]
NENCAGDRLTPNWGVPISDLGDGRFLFRLYFEVDVDRIENDGYKRIMQLRVRIDIRKSLKRKKKFAFLNGLCAYVCFEYKKLTLCYLLCGKLRYGESFCQIRALHSRHDYDYQMDISLGVSSCRVDIWRNRWLV